MNGRKQKKIKKMRRKADPLRPLAAAGQGRPFAQIGAARPSSPQIKGGSTMNSLGISIVHDGRDREDDLSPSYPLLAFAYYRSGFLRLAGSRRRAGCRK